MRGTAEIGCPPIIQHSYGKGIFKWPWRCLTMFHGFSIYVPQLCSSNPQYKQRIYPYKQYKHSITPVCIPQLYVPYMLPQYKHWCLNGIFSEWYDLIPPHSAHNWLTWLPSPDSLASKMADHKKPTCFSQALRNKKIEKRWEKYRKSLFYRVLVLENCEHLFNSLAIELFFIILSANLWNHPRAQRFSRFEWYVYQYITYQKWWSFDNEFEMVR